MAFLASLGYNPQQNQANLQTAPLTSAQQQQQALAGQLQNANGVGNEQQVYGQQQALAGTLGQLAAGQGPNPALAQLQQTTGQNVANQAALMAGQRGAGANAGLIARQAAQQGASTQQQAAGQAATLQAQQQLAYTNALQQQQAQMAALASGQVGQLQGANAQQAQTALGAQQQALSQQQGVASAEQGQLNSGLQTIGSLAKGLSGMSAVEGDEGAGEAGAGAMGAQGGVLSQQGFKYAAGGQVGMSANLKENYGGPKSKLGQHFHKYKDMKPKAMFAHGGKVDALVSPGEIYLKPHEAKMVAKGKMHPLQGEKIPGKPRVGGAKNSYANDTVQKKLDVGGVIIPRSKTQAQNAPKKAQDFVEAVLSRQGLKRK